MRKSLRVGMASSAVVSGMLGAAAVAEASTVPTPITVSGWNRDVVIGDTNPYYANNFYSSAGSSTNFAFVENGATTATGSGGAAFTGGLPTEAFDSTVNFNSSYTNSVTGGNTVFQFQPFDTSGTESGSPSPNILALPGSSSPGTLTLTAPAEFSSLAVLSTVASGTGALTGGYVITFSDSSTVSGSYNAINWTTTSATVAYTMADLAKSLNPDAGGNSPTWAVDTINIYLAETDINLSGVLTSDGATASTLPIDSITFTGSVESSSYTGIFALSGVAAVPEPASMALLGMASLGLLARRRRR